MLIYNKGKEVKNIVKCVCAFATSENASFWDYSSRPSPIGLIFFKTRKHE